MYQQRRYYNPERSNPFIIKLSEQSGRGLGKIRRDVGSAEKWIKKSYKKTKTLKKTKVYSYTDEGFIRYVAVFPNGDTFVFSENPLSPMGTKKYLGNIFDNQNLKPLGKKIDINAIPREVKLAIKQTMNGIK